MLIRKVDPPSRLCLGLIEEFRLSEIIGERKLDRLVYEQRPRVTLRHSYAGEWQQLLAWCGKEFVTVQPGTTVVQSLLAEQLEQLEYLVSLSVSPISQRLVVEIFAVC